MSAARPEPQMRQYAEDAAYAEAQSAGQACMSAQVSQLAEISGGEGTGCEGSGGEGTGGADLAGRSEAESRTILVAQTARFTASFLRWMETRACGGMSYARLRLLQALHCGGPAIMRDLGTQLGTTPRNMTAMVDALEDAHLVVRRAHPTDRRATLIELSPDGVREVEEGLGPRLDAMAEIFAGLSPGEREQFSAALTKLMRAIKDRQQEC